MEIITQYKFFSEKICQYLYFYNIENKNKILKIEYEKFIKGVEYTKKLIKDKFNKIFQNNLLNEKLDSMYDNNNLEFNQILIETFETFLNDEYSNKTIDNDGYCLLSNLIGKAVQMKNNKDMLGVINDIDKNNSRFIIVDFADEDLVKIDIDELYIGGQKTH